MQDRVGGTKAFAEGVTDCHSCSPGCGPSSLGPETWICSLTQEWTLPRLARVNHTHETSAVPWMPSHVMIRGLFAKHEVQKKKGEGDLEGPRV